MRRKITILHTIENQIKDTYHLGKTELAPKGKDPRNKPHNNNSTSFKLFTGINFGRLLFNGGTHQTICSQRSFCIGNI